MAVKPGDWNAEVLAALENSGSLLQFTFSVGLSAAPVIVNSTPINWVYFQNSRANTGFIRWGGSNLSGSGSTRGPEVGPSGETPLIRLSDLSDLWVISNVAAQEIFVVAGRRT